MKYVVLLFALVSLGLLGIGLYHYINDNHIYNKYFGFGTVGLFFITFPLFLFWRRDKFDLKNYTWHNSNRDENSNQSKSR